MNTTESSVAIMYISRTVIRAWTRNFTGAFHCLYFSLHFNLAVMAGSHQSEFKYFQFLAGKKLAKVPSFGGTRPTSLLNQNQKYTSQDLYFSIKYFIRVHTRVKLFADFSPRLWSMVFQELVIFGPLTDEQISLGVRLCCCLRHSSKDCLSVARAARVQLWSMNQSPVRHAVLYNRRNSCEIRIFQIFPLKKLTKQDTVKLFLSKQR